MKTDGKDESDLADATALTQLGRDPQRYSGFVNAPVFRGSTVLFPDARKPRVPSGRIHLWPSLEPYDAGARTCAGETRRRGANLSSTPSGLSAVSTTLLAFAEAGGHILISDSVYQPTRRFANRVLKRLGVDIEYYDPLIGDGIAKLLRPETKLVFTEFLDPRLLKCRIFRRFAKQREALACPSPSTTPGPHRFISGPSTTASPSRSRPPQSTSSDTRTPFSALSLATRPSARAVAGMHEALGLCANGEDLLPRPSRAAYALGASRTALEVGPCRRRMAADPPRGGVGAAPCPARLPWP